MSRVSEAEVRDALGAVTEPESGRSVLELGVVNGLTVKEGHVQVVLEVPGERAQAFEAVRKACETRIGALGGVLSATVVMTAERPQGRGTESVQAGPARGGAQGRGQQQPQRPLAPGVRAIVAVASGKGGVGKSTTATNLAVAMKRLGLRVGLLDADIYGPSQPRMLGIVGRPNSPDGKTLEPMSNYGVKCMSMGFLVAEDTPMIWRGPMVQGALQQMLRDVSWGELDIMLVDMPPGTGDAQLTMAQQVPLAGAIIVSTPQDIALLDARKGLNMFRKVDVPVLGIIENMSYFVCPNCDHVSHIFDHGGAHREADKLGAEFLGEIPLDLEIRETSDGGRPIVVSNPDSPHSEAYMAIAKRAWEKIEARLGAPERSAPKIVMN